VTGEELAGLIVAVFWAVLVALLAVVLVRLAQALRQATRLVESVTEQAVPLLGQAADAVRAAHTQLDRVDTITADVAEVTANASALSTTVASTFGGPLVKVAAFGYGVRRAVRLQRPGTRGAAPVVPGRVVPAARAAGRSASWFGRGRAKD
jgi:predicted PurR-regulated permease PerM